VNSFVPNLQIVVTGVSWSEFDFDLGMFFIDLNLFRKTNKTEEQERTSDIERKIDEIQKKKLKQKQKQEGEKEKNVK